MLNKKGLVPSAVSQRVGSQLSKVENCDNKIARDILSQIWFYFLLKLALLQFNFDFELLLTGSIKAM